MTPALAQITRTPRSRHRVRPTCAGTLREDLLALLEETSGIRWPSDKYAQDPCGFAEQILGIRLSPSQRVILEAARDHRRVSVRSGHKVGKSTTAAIIALWEYCTRPEGRVIFTAPTARQVDAILWRELAKLRSRAGCCVRCREQCARDNAPEPRPCEHSSLIAGQMNSLARSGFRSHDFREVVGFTARDAEAVAGISGPYLRYIVDESSGVGDDIFEAIEGNRAGGASLVLFSNPTRTEGEFFRSHKEKAQQVGPDGKIVGFYRCIHVSSEDTPNVLEGRDVFPGLATREWVDEKRAEWGEDSPLYKVRVRGEFVENEDGKILSIHALTQAEERWATTPAEGRLHIGLDPAGPGQGGDESVFAVRRGLKIVQIYPLRGLTEDAHVSHLIGLLKEHRRRREQSPVVTIDREGPIGASLYGRLKAVAASRRHDSFEIVGVRSSDKAAREPQIYDRVRDELWACLAAWFRDGGAIPEDARLSLELHAPSWFQPLGSAKLKVTPKSELRKMLDGRSPDRADAVALSVWEAISVRVESEADDVDVDVDSEPPSRGGRGFDPYASRVGR